jgi:hypothetical protein
MNVHWRKWNNEREGKPDQKCYVAFGTIFTLFGTMFRISKCFKEASRNFIFSFLFNKGRLKI